MPVVPSLDPDPVVSLLYQLQCIHDQQLAGQLPNQPNRLHNEYKEAKEANPGNLANMDYTAAEARKLSKMTQ